MDCYKASTPVRRSASGGRSEPAPLRGRRFRLVPPTFSLERWQPRMGWHCHCRRPPSAPTAFRDAIRPRRVERPPNPAMLAGPCRCVYATEPIHTDKTRRIASPRLKHAQTSLFPSTSDAHALTLKAPSRCPNCVKSERGRGSDPRHPTGERPRRPGNSFTESA